MNLSALGCLSGNGRDAPIEGSYTFCRRGLKEAFFPDLMEERAGRSGSIPFSGGSLTDGDPDTMVGWKGSSVGETGVDIVVDLKRRYFVDRIVLQPGRRVRREAPPAQTVIDAPGAAVDPVEPVEPGGVEVYARAEKDAPYRLVGKDRERERTFPLSPEGSVSLGVEAIELIVRLSSFNRDILVSELEVWGANPEDPALFPVPQGMERSPQGEPFRLQNASSVMVGQAASEDTRFAANLLVEKLAETFGRTLPVARETGVEDPRGWVALGKPGECGRLDKAGVLSQVRPEGYGLSVRGDGVLLLASDRRGLVYGVEALLQMLGRDGADPAIEPCRIEDYPKMGLRGVHFFVPAREDIPFIKRLIRHLLAPMRYNTIFLELAGGMKFDRRPEINEAWERANQRAAEGEAPRVPHGSVCGGSYLTKEEVRDLVAYARSYGLDVIPEIQSLSHVEYLTLTYPDIAERKGDVYPDSYCPLHPESHRIVFDMIDEVVEVFHPLRYVHMGHDEVYTMAVCERCRGKSRAELYAHDVNKIYDYLKGKGLGMMVWADMLHAFQRYAGAEAIDAIPKDILMLDFVWYFRTHEDIETTLLKKGFKVIMGNFYSSHYTRFVSRSAREGIIGAEVSTWCRADERNFGRLGKIYDLMYSANMMWSPTCREELRWTMDRKISELMPDIRSRLGDSPPPSRAGATTCLPIDLADGYNAPLQDETGALGGYDFSGLPKGDGVLGDVPFRIGEGVVLVQPKGVRAPRYPAEVEVHVGAMADSLVLLHSCSASGPLQGLGSRHASLGRYEVCYEDGSAAAVDIEYGWQVAEWNRRHGAPLGHTAHRHAGYIATYPCHPVWQGKTPSGEDVTLYGFEWRNPHPGKAIRTLRISASEAATDAALIVVAVTRITCGGPR